MNAAPALLGYAATVGWVAPRLMLRGGWPYRSPVLAATVWTALAASFSLCVALSALHLATPGAHLHGILYSCSAALGGSPPGTATMERLGPAASAVVVTAHAASFTFHALRARVARNRHRRILDKVGRPSAGLRATVDGRRHQEPYAASQLVPTAGCRAEGYLGGHQQQPFSSASGHVPAAATATTASRRSSSACPKRGSASSYLVRRPTGTATTSPQSRKHAR